MRYRGEVLKASIQPVFDEEVDEEVQKYLEYLRRKAKG